MNISEISPRAWMRRWKYNGEEPKKEKNENGRLAWPSKFKFLPVTESMIFKDDIPLVPVEDLQHLKSQIQEQEIEINRLRALLEMDKEGHSHQCRKCLQKYTPEPLQSEDCPRCGFDGKFEVDEHV